jgi:acyl-CoA thioesterase-1
VRRDFLIRSGFTALLALLAALVPAASARAVEGTGGKAAAAGPVLLVVGDSLSAEYGLVRGTGWVQLLADRLRATGSDYRVVNASISGETTSGGRTRLPALLKQHRPAVVVLELGANDGLRGLPLTVMRDNLAAMIRDSQASGAQVLLVGVRVPPNYGRDYSDRFFATFGALAKQHKTALAPFLLDGFADSLDLFQSDRIHPAAEAQPRILDNVWPALQPLLARARR